MCRGRRAGSGRRSRTPRSPGRSRLREVVAADGEAVEDARELVLPPVHAPGAATTCAAQKRVEPIRPLRCAPRRGDHAGPRRHHSRLARPPAAAFSLAVTRPGLLLRLRQRQGAVSRPAQVRGGFGPQEAQPRPRHGQRAEAPERPMAGPPWGHTRAHTCAAHTYAHARAHTRTRPFTRTRARARTYAHARAHAHAHAHAFAHTHTHTHAHAPAHAPAPAPAPAPARAPGTTPLDNPRRQHLSSQTSPEGSNPGKPMLWAPWPAPPPGRAKANRPKARAHQLTERRRI